MIVERRRTRRELVRGLARWFALGLLAGGGAFLLRRNGDPERCTLRISCARCGLRDGCTLRPGAPRDRERDEPSSEESWRIPSTKSPGESS